MDQIQAQEKGGQRSKGERDSHLKQRQDQDSRHLGQLERVKLQTKDEERKNDPDGGDVTYDGWIADPSQDERPDEHARKNLASLSLTKEMLTIRAEMAKISSP